MVVRPYSVMLIIPPTYYFQGEDMGNNPKTFNEEWSKDQKIKSQTLKAFGSNPQPSLEKIEFKVNVIIRDDN